MKKRKEETKFWKAGNEKISLLVLRKIGLEEDEEKLRMRRRTTGATTLTLLLCLGIFLLVPINGVEGKQTSYACEGSMLRLDCDPGLVIHLIRAIYGRFSITICNENGNTDWSVNCGSPKSILVLNGTCNYQRSCSVLASTRTFGDPCPGTVKYLEVQYQCISEKSLATTTRPKLLPPPHKSSSASNSNPNSKWSSNNNNEPDSIAPSSTPSSLPTTTTKGPLILLGVNGDDETFLPYDSSLGTETGGSLGYHNHNETNHFLEGHGHSQDTSSAILNVMTSASGSGPTTPSSLTTTLSGSSTVRHYKSQGPGQEESDETEEEDDNDDEPQGPRFNMDVKWTDTGSDGEDLVVKVRVTPTIPSYIPPAPKNQRPVQQGPQDSQVCESRLDRGMFWNFTAPGITVRQPCPGGASGIAKWSCVLHSLSKIPVWVPESPDLSDCKSAWLGSLQARVLEPDQIPTVLAGELAQVTSTKQMYGGDIGAAVRIMKALALRKHEELRSLASQSSREELAGELLQKILDAGSNLLEKTRLEPWRDLSWSDKMANATGLLVGLEDNAFLLANVLNSEKITRKTSKNILTTIYALDSANVREINFPADSSSPLENWGRYGDVLRMPAEALRENSDGGLVRLVCFAYNNLEHVLQPIDFSESEEEETGISRVPKKLVNSRVLSASLNQGRHIQLTLPVHLTFRHLWADNVSNPQCVFWDYTLNAWSEEGCRVVSTNRSHTECQCTHLTNFAILMDLAPPVRSLQSPQILQVMMYVGSAVVILCLAFALLITHFCIRGKVFQTMILKNLFLCMLVSELIFVIGLDETGKSWACTSIALFLHYASLASFLWLFLHGFHLHLIVVEAAESGLSRQLWYYGVSYGSPAIVVLLSFLLDPRGYRSETHCWIHSNFIMLCFVGPAIVVALATAGVLIFTSYRVCGLLSALPKKPNDDKGLYVYAGTWLRGSTLILISMIVVWTLRLINIDSNSSSIGLAYASSLTLALQGIVILVFHVLKSEDMITKLCDCSRLSEHSDLHTEMQGSSSHNSHAHGLLGTGTELETCHPIHNNGIHRGSTLDGSGNLGGTLGRHPNFHHPQALYSKQTLIGLQQPNGPSPGGVGLYPAGTRYGFTDPQTALGLLYGSGGGGSRGGYGARADPVYEEIERISPSRGSISDLSEEDDRPPHHYPHSQHLRQQPQEYYSAHDPMDLYNNRSLYAAAAQQQLQHRERSNNSNQNTPSHIYSPNYRHYPPNPPDLYPNNHTHSGNSSSSNNSNSHNNSSGSGGLPNSQSHSIRKKKSSHHHPHHQQPQQHQSQPSQISNHEHDFELDNSSSTNPLLHYHQQHLNKPSPVPKYGTPQQQQQLQQAGILMSGDEQQYLQQKVHMV